MSTINIAPKSGAQDIWEISEDIASTLALYAYHEDETPVPWDASIEVIKDVVYLEGSIIGGSSNTPSAAGYCLCKISVEKFPRVYRIEVPSEYLSTEEDIEALEGAGWYISK